jgi:hypothetical protein
MSVFVLLLLLMMGCSTNSPPTRAETHNEKPPVSANHAPTSVCDNYGVEEDTDTNSVKVESGGQVLHSIKLLTDKERNGFAFDGVKKNKEGFELAIEYGSRMFYHKNFIFVCKDDKFNLSKIEVDSFDRQDPDKSSKNEVIKVQPNVPIEKFSITDFMPEGVVQH